MSVEEGGCKQVGGKGWPYSFIHNLSMSCVNMRNNKGYTRLEQFVGKRWGSIRAVLGILLLVLSIAVFALMITGWSMFADYKSNSTARENDIRDKEEQKALQREAELREEAHRNLTTVIHNMTAEAERNLREKEREVRQEEEQKRVEREKEIREEEERKRQEKEREIREEEELKRAESEKKIRHEEEEKRQELQKVIEQQKQEIEQLKHTRPQCNTGHMTTAAGHVWVVNLIALATFFFLLA